MVLIGIGFTLIGISAILSLIAVVISIKQGFEEGTAWGLANLFGFLCLGSIPNLIFSLMDLKHRSEFIVINLGVLIPIAIGFYLIVSGTMVQSIQ